jgi:sec-independent protein translocase protein TatC
VVACLCLTIFASYAKGLCVLRLQSSYSQFSGGFSITKLSSSYRVRFATCVQHKKLAKNISGVLGPLNLQIKVALLTGVILAAPAWLYQLWAFIAPGLHKKEKRNSIFFIIAATPFFSAGAFLGYAILPAAVKVLFGFTPDALNNLVKFDDYLDFVLRIILLFGLAFELPVFLISLNLIGFLRGQTILKPWRIWVFSIVLFVAAFTPTADPLTMGFLAVPLIALYFASGGFAVLNDKRRDKKNLDRV